MFMMTPGRTAPILSAVTIALLAATDGQARGRHRAAVPPPPPVPAVCASADDAPTAENLVVIARATICLVNQARKSHGLVALAENSRLDRSASQHSLEMVAADYFGHVSPLGTTPQARDFAARYIHTGVRSRVGENLGIGTTGADSPASIVKAWLAEPGHRAVLLNPVYRETGVGMAAAPPRSFAGGGAGATYSQEFGVIG